MRLGMMVAVLVAMGAVGCASNRTAGLGAMTDGDSVLLRGHYADFEPGGFGMFGAIGAGGQTPDGDDYDDNKDPFVPAPESGLSTRSGETSLAGGIQGGVTYQPHDRVGLLLGASLWGEETYTEYQWTSPFHGSGKYYETDDLELKVGVVLGVELILQEEGATLGVHYDSALEMLGVSVGFSF